MSPSTQPDPEARLIYVRLLLEFQPHYELISKKWLAMRGKTKQAHAYEDALAASKWALRDQITEFAKCARERGQLLFCFEGTTVLQGGAA